eukprot:scaffold2509_cov169-Amphora_coffeaeformis.AAC.4
MDWKAWSGGTPETAENLLINSLKCKIGKEHHHSLFQVRGCLDYHNYATVGEGLHKCDSSFFKESENPTTSCTFSQSTTEACIVLGP